MMLAATVVAALTLLTGPTHAQDQADQAYAQCKAGYAGRLPTLPEWSTCEKLHAQRTTSTPDDTSAPEGLISTVKYIKIIPILRADGGPFYDDHQEWRVDITVRGNVTVQSIKVNRGNCKTFEDGELPVTMKFGDVLTVIPTPVFQCNPIEMSIATDRGIATFSWE